MSTKLGRRQTEQSPFLPSGSYFITNVRHDVSLSLPDRQDEVCGSLKRNFTWKIFNDSNAKWYIQGGAGPWFAHRRPSPRAGNTIIASQEQFGWVIGQCHPIRDPDCYLIYAMSDHTLLWGLADGEDQTPVTLCTGETNKKNWWRFQRIPDGNEDQLGSPVDADLPRYVAVMGTTGSGMSSFINDATGLKLDVRNDLDSCTNRVYSTRILLDGRPVVLLDTPGFGHSGLPEAEVLQLMAEYLANLYRKEIKLSGLLYMQRVSIPRVDSQTLRYFRIFQKLCGHANLDHTQVVTTCWTDVEAKVGGAREKEFMNGVFKPVLDAGGRIVRHDQTIRSAKAILRHVLEKDVVLLKIQSQLVDDGKNLYDTDAGLEIPRSAEAGKPRGFRRWLRKLWGA